jgi:hypothetical protein
VKEVRHHLTNTLAPTSSQSAEACALQIIISLLVISARALRTPRYSTRQPERPTGCGTVPQPSSYCTIPSMGNATHASVRSVCRPARGWSTGNRESMRVPSDDFGRWVYFSWSVGSPSSHRPIFIYSATTRIVSKSLGRSRRSRSPVDRNCWSLGNAIARTLAGRFGRALSSGRSRLSRHFFLTGSMPVCTKMEMPNKRHSQPVRSMKEITEVEVLRMV